MDIPKKRSLVEILAEKKKLREAEINKQNQEIEENLQKFEEPKEIIHTIAPKKKLTLKEILENNRKLKEKAKEVLTSPIPKVETITTLLKEEAKKTESFSLSISLNEKQLLATELAFNGKSFCLIGKAGTGKTTTQREIALSLLRQNKLKTHDFRIQGTGEKVTAPSIAFVAYTRIAAGNLRSAIHKLPELEEALTHNITTIHNLLEYAPVYYYDEELDKETMRFIPNRTASKPLDITHLVIEESSMVGLDLWKQLFAALREGVQIIFLGDINQLPPVFGSSILSYAMLQLPIVELTEVYRQAGDSLILENAHRILEGRKLEEGKDFEILRSTTQYSQFKQSHRIKNAISKWMDAGIYDPLEDIFLSPWNKQDLGTINLNYLIANVLGQKRNAIVYEILAGRNKWYLAVGDKIFYNKQVGVIKEITKNATYVGKAPMKESETLTRFGVYTGASVEDSMEEDTLLDYSNFSIDKIAEDADDEKKTAASHTVTLEMETGEEITMEKLGDFSESTFSLGYALTVHKAQGCEWNRVFIVFHRDHAVSLFRELFYTAVTRARKKVVLIMNDAQINSAISNQRLKGDSLAEKIEYFNAGILNAEDVQIIK